MWQSLLFYPHYHYYPNAGCHSHCLFHNILSPHFALKSPNRIFMLYLGEWSKTCTNSPYKLSFESSLSPDLVHAVQNNDIKLATSQNLWHPITNKLHPLNCWYCFVMYKISCSWLMIFESFSIEQNIVPCSYSSPPPHLTSRTPTNPIYILLLSCLLL